MTGLNLALPYRNIALSAKLLLSTTYRMDYSVQRVPLTQDKVQPFLATNMCYMATPFSRILRSQEFLISSARAFSSSTSQLTQTNLPLRNAASGEASHSVN